jgi:transketolase
MSLNKEILSAAATQARGLAIDGVVAAGNAGHLGLPLGAAEIGAALYGELLNVNPDNPKWLNRDRFILSAGHGSMFIYSWLHMAGFNVSKEDLSKFRHLHSITPGHPEYGETDGVECTTGPLGQGVGNAVGFAVSAKMAQAHFNTDDHKIFDYSIVCLAGDGCLQEGVALEAIEFAGHNKLDNLILIFDSNDVTLDAMADKTQSTDVEAKFAALGWGVATIDGHDLDAIQSAYQNAKAATGKPQIIIAKTEIGRGIPEVAGTSKAHGESGAGFADKSKEAMGLSADENFYVSDEVKAYFAAKTSDRAAVNSQWDELYSAWKSANPAKAETLEKSYKREMPSVDELFAAIPEFEVGKAVATRASGGVALNALAQSIPTIVSGSADLHGSTKNYLNDADGDFSDENPAGRNLLFGIREHAMGAIVNGLAYEGLFNASGATFFTFSDYMRPSVRLSALTGIPALWYWTHDSVGVGVDGPTHQPVETIASLRCVPNLDMIKPGDAEETAGALVAAIERTDGPTGLSLSRQNLPDLNTISVAERRNGVLKGAYVAKKEEGALEAVIISCGSELSLALDAAAELGSGVRVVSMPCTSRFDRQDAAYQESVLPAACRKRVAVEAAATQSWYKYTGLDGKVIGIDRFGLSAPGDQVLNELGVTKQAVVDAVNGL